jgi:hypothetical protein
VELDDHVLPVLGWSRDHRPGRKPVLDDAELLCLAVAQHLLGIASERRYWLKYPSPAARRDRLDELGKPLAGLLTAADGTPLAGEVVAALGEHDDDVLACLRSNVGYGPRRLLLGVGEQDLLLTPSTGRYLILTGTQYQYGGHREHSTRRGRRHQSIP